MEFFKNSDGQLDNWNFSRISIRIPVANPGGEPIKWLWNSSRISIKILVANLSNDYGIPQEFRSELRWQTLVANPSDDNGILQEFQSKFQWQTLVANQSYDYGIFQEFQSEFWWQTYQMTMEFLKNFDHNSSGNPNGRHQMTKNFDQISSDKSIRWLWNSSRIRSEFRMANSSGKPLFINNIYLKPQISNTNNTKLDPNQTTVFLVSQVVAQLLTRDNWKKEKHIIEGIFWTNLYSKALQKTHTFLRLLILTL